MNYLVSLIIPTYNYGEFISNAIVSILKQTYDNYEIIVVDDGSTDGTKNIVKSFKNNKIKYIYQENQGANVARNRGFKESSGEYIIFLDSDDILGSKHIKEYLKVGVTNPGSNVYGPSKKGYFSNGQFKVKYNMGSCPNNDLLASWIKADWWAFTSSVMWPRNNIVKVGGWDETLHANQDGDIAMRALIEGISFVYAENAPKAFITMHNNEKPSITSTKNIKTLSSRYHVLNKIENLLKNKNMFSNRYKTALAFAFLSIAKNTLSSYPEFSDSCFKEFRRLYGYKKPPGSYMNWIGLSILGLKNKQKLADIIGVKIPWRF